MYYDLKQFTLGVDPNFNVDVLHHDRFLDVPGAAVDVFHHDPFLDVPGVTILIEENKNDYHHAWFVLCPSNNNKFPSLENIPVPTFVSILPNIPSGLNYTERLPVINPNNGRPRAYQQNLKKWGWTML